MSRTLLTMLSTETRKLEQSGLYKPQRAHDPALVDFTSQDYLALAGDQRIHAAARAALDERDALAGGGTVGTRSPHHPKLEQALARFLGVADALVFGSGYLANLGLFEALFDSRDCLFCDALVHPSVAEGVRLSSATAFPFHNNDVEDLEDKLKRSRTARFRAVVTDGVFPFDGRVAALEAICTLAERYEALVIVDDALGIGVLGATGRGTRELRGVMPRVDIVTGTFAKALGAPAGGFVAGKREVIEWLRQKATPYLFSTPLAAAPAAAATAAIEILERGEPPLAQLHARTRSIKEALEALDYRVLGGEHPSLAIVIGNVVPLQRMVNALYERRVHVTGVCYPVVPEGEARIRLETSLRLSDADVTLAVRAFEQVRK